MARITSRLGRSLALPEFADLVSENMKHTHLLTLFVTCLLSGSALRAADEPAPDYAADVVPLLTKYCAGCHNDDDRDGDFSLESFASLQEGTENGPALLPGDAGGSRMIRVLTGDAEPAMPPEGEPRPTDEELALLTAWIEAGALGPDGTEIDRTVLHVPSIESRTETRPVSAVDWSAD